MAFNRWPVWARALGAGACFAIVACTDGGGTVPLELSSHAKLETGIVALWKQGGSLTLASLTDFDWDSVALYPEGTLASVIHADLGQPVLGEQKYFDNARNLIVFRLQGKPVRLVLNSAALFAHGDYGRWFGRSLTLTAKAPGEGLLSLSQP
jgi:hypothetical protein